MAFLRKRGYHVSSTKADILRGLAAAGCAFAEALLRYSPSSALSGPPIIIFASVPQQPQNRNLCAVQIHADLDNFAI